MMYFHSTIGMVPVLQVQGGSNYEIVDACAAPHGTSLPAIQMPSLLLPHSLGQRSKKVRGAVPAADRGRQLHPRMPGVHCRHIAVLGWRGNWRRSSNSVSFPTCYGTEFISKASTDGCAPLGRLRCNRLPGNGRVAERNSVPSLTLARTTLADWRTDYNVDRPHSSIGWQTPNEYAATFAPQRGLTLRTITSPGCTTRPSGQN
jgi:hypothetical protein